MAPRNAGGFFWEVATRPVDLKRRRIRFGPNHDRCVMKQQHLKALKALP